MMIRKKLTVLAAAFATFGAFRGATASVATAQATPLAQAAILAEQAAAAGGTTVVGEDGWLYFAPELRHLGVGRFWGDAAASVSRATKPEFADPLPAIVDFNGQLEGAGIELILVPVPPKAVIYPEHLFADSDAPATNGRIDDAHQAFYKLLREQGVEVLDLVPALLKAKKTSHMFCKQDTHWSGQACVEVARILKERLAEMPWFAAHPKNEYTSETIEREITGDLWTAPGDDSIAKEKVTLRQVGAGAPGGLEPVPPDPKSPVVLLGDSHNLVFHAGSDMHAVGAGLPDQLALELGFPVDLVAVRGSGATPARVNLLRRARAPGYLEGKKVVIWCFTAREFTESSGWTKVPVIR